MIDAQEWLDKEYPKESRSEIKKIYLNEPSLEGELDLSDFINKQGLKVKIYIAPDVDETKLDIKNKLERVEIILQNPQKYLQQKYPTKEDRKKEKDLDIDHKNLLGDLDISDFINLKTLRCPNNKLTSIDVNNCLHLEKICCQSNQLTSLNTSNCYYLTSLDCSNNLLTNLILPTNPVNLRSLKLISNNFGKVYSQDLSFLVPYINLEILELGNVDKRKIDRNIYNRFTGSLDYLSNMKRLKKLEINNTDINEFSFDKLPNSLEFIRYLTKERLSCKLTDIIPQLDKYYGKFGRCLNCLQPKTNKNRCQLCTEKQWGRGSKHLVEQEVVKKLINKQPVVNLLKKLKWIPYEQFTEIEKIGEGGFSKVYKAKWINSKIVALKILNNSQDISENFLREIVNHQTLFSCSMVVKCHGISQDLQTNNYLMVMDYVKDGDLRNFLQNNWLRFEDKLRDLLNIAWGLSEIHSRNLIHRDFHSGNILNEKVGNWQKPSKCCIADLGLCRPANDDGESKIYGVLPYIAPEVLRGQPYTQASDIYSFGIVAYEILAGKTPYQEHAHNEFLAVKICKGLRPNLDGLKIPQLLKDLIEECWDANPKRRPKANELATIKRIWLTETRNNKSTEFAQQYQEVVKADEQKFCQGLSKLYKEYKGKIKEVKPEEIEEVKKELFKEFFKKRDYRKYNKGKKVKKANKEISNFLAKGSGLTCVTHPQATCTSRLLDFKNLPQPKNSKKINQTFYKLVDELEELRITDAVKFSEEFQKRFKNSESSEIFIVKSEEIPPIETQEQPMLTDWTNIHLNFTPQLVNQWKTLNFTPQQVKDYLSIGLQPSDHSFAAYLRDHKQLTPEEVLNQGNYEQLSQEFFTYWQRQDNSLIEIPPK